MIEALVLVSLLTLVVSRRLLELSLRTIAPPTLGKRFSPLRWAEAFIPSTPVLLDRVLKAAT